MSAGTPLQRLVTMSVRARAALKASGISTLEEAADLDDQELLAIPFFGESSLLRLRDWQASSAETSLPAPDFNEIRRRDFTAELVRILVTRNAKASPDYVTSARAVAEAVYP